MCVCVLIAQPCPSVLVFVTPWTVARQAPLSMEFFRQEYWSQLSFPSPGDLPEPGIYFRTNGQKRNPFERWEIGKANVLLKHQGEKIDFKKLNLENWGMI